MAEEAALDSVELEATGQLSEWIELKRTTEEDGELKVSVIGRVRLTFIPSGVWASILNRRELLTKGAAVLAERLEKGTSEDAAKDAERFGTYQTSLLEVVGETVARSVRQIEGREPLEVVGDMLTPKEVEALAVDGLFWECWTAVREAHWTSPETKRAMFRGWMG